MTSKFKELEILFYGNTYIPTSTHCWGCEHFNYLCEGSVYRGECPTGQVEEINDSEIALQILEDEQVNHNRFLLFRIIGTDLNDKDHVEHIEELKVKVANNLDNPNKKDYVEAIQQAINAYYAAKDLPDSLITALQSKYLVEI